LRDLEFGAHPVRGGDEDRIGEPVEIEMKQTAEPAEAPHDLFTHRAAHKRFDFFHKEIGLVDIHAGLLIGCRHFYILPRPGLRRQ